jgi:5-formyltetrahydrofolate cyclo-ligase
MDPLTIISEKTALRRTISRLKAAQSPQQYMEASAIITGSLEMLPEFRSAKTILAYWSFKGEVHTHDLIRKWAEKKRILLPSVNGDEMLIRQYLGDDSLVPGEIFGIPEPAGPVFTDYNEIDLVIIPGIAFDRKNNRMGRGKAYYDRFLSKISGFKAGICFSFQLFESIPADEHDILMDIVITEGYQNERRAFLRN